VSECSVEFAAGSSSLVGFVADTNGWNTGTEWQQSSGEQRLHTESCGAGELADSQSQRECPNQLGRDSSKAVELAGAKSRCDSSNNGPTSFWSEADWIYCRDEKYRPVEPGTFPLAYGATNRVGRLRGYGNAIVAPQAAEFILAFKEAKLMQEIMS
jgi:DNA (cytosine-5)-methyltransferase 1